MSLTVSQAVWLAPGVTAVHFLEERSRFANRARRRISNRYTDEHWRRIHALGMLSAIGFAVLVSLGATTHYVFLFTSLYLAPMLFNLAFHAWASFWYRSYSPGLISAYFLRRAPGGIIPERCGIGKTMNALKGATSMGLRLSYCMTAALALALALAATTARAELPVKRVITLGVAKKIAAAAEAEATKRGSAVVIVVVDDGGHLLVLERLDDTQVASVEVGIGKARTAAIFRRPSKEFEDQVRNGRVAALALPGATPLQGGIPITFQGKVIGAVGVSGNTPQEDEDIAKAGAAAAEAAIAAQR